MDPLVPHFKFGMLSLQHRGAAVCMGPVFEADLIVVSQHVFNFQPLGPGVHQPLLRPLEIVFNMALPAHIGAHLLARRHRVDIVILQPLSRFERPHPLDKPRPRDSKLHRPSVMAVNTGHRMGHQLPGFGKWHLTHALEAFDQVALAELFVHCIDGRMAVQAGAGLLDDRLAFGEGLIREHVGMPSIFTKILRKGIPSPHGLQTHVLFEARLGDNRARVHLCRCAGHSLTAAEPCTLLVYGAQIGIVLQRKVLAPERRITGLVVELDHPIERISGLLFALKDVDQQRCTSGRQHSCRERDNQDWQVAAARLGTM